MMLNPFDYFALVCYLFALFFSWKDINARYLILCILASSAVALSTLEWAFSKPIGFYVWSMSMSLLFLLFVFIRRYVAYKFYRIKFFAEAYDKHTYTVQEATLIAISLVCVVNNFVAFVEVYFYWIDWLDNAYYKLYVRDNLQKLMIILTSLVSLSFTIKSWKLSTAKLSNQ